MDEAGKRKLRGTGCPAGGRHGLENNNAKPGACQKDGGSETIGPRADDNGIMGAGSHALLALMNAADGATPGLVELKEDEHGPHRQPKADGAEGEHEMKGVLDSPAPKNPRQMAPAAKHGAIFLGVPWNRGGFVEGPRIDGDS